ncbi:beta-phosphoglucomutase family hydrolase [Demequina capsici]|uniref:Beta-phosphoglucomutase family hydrolase n=1 Tax=Demequina capsici TaxID=3075620 RepID=A0AA96FG14_9MICO|nr:MULTISPECIES: beta-phosphoglucomutase family hydrolase [unclassified Demequina]WNM25035.1 beta-phosphoglucomutase family hydrolase [Demequina sp. OYTSA14]WNM27941.1 beta-phosphoglucomutase family hydrolase [Demequina sp. PMTSA13]
MSWYIPQAPGEGFAAALFDLDGVLTPTAEVHMAAWKRTFDEYFDRHGIAPEFSDADYFAHVDGVPRYDGVARCLASRGVEVAWGDPSDAPGTDTVCGIGNAKNEAYTAVLKEQGVTPYPGSVALLDHLAELGDVAMAVVCSSRNTDAVLAAAGIADRFSVVVDGDTATDKGLPGKPAPDTFLYAAELLGVPASGCVVIEDALTGVAAGHAGGFGLVLGVDRGAGADALEIAGADVVVKDLSETVQR